MQIHEPSCGYAEQLSEADMNYIADALHGDILQLLCFLQRILNNLQTNNLNKNTQQELVTATELTSNAISGLRGIIANITPPNVEINLIGELYNLIGDAQAKNTDKMNFSFKFDGDGVSMRKILNKNIKLTIYRVVQEAINNAIKHSKAKNVKVALTFNKTLGYSLEDSNETSLATDAYLLEVSILDDGIGTDLPYIADNSQWNSSHFGLNSMRQRVVALGGDIVFQSAPNQGMQVMVSWLIKTSNQQPSLILD